MVVVVIGADEQETFDSTLDAVVDFGGGNTVPVTLTGPVVIRVSGRALNPTGTFATEIVSMSLTGNLGGQTVEIRESPSQASLGETTVTDLGGGLFDVDSFFDPFTEISIDGGPFIADQNGPSHIQNIIPSPGAALLALIGLGAARRIRRRRRVARA